MATSKKPNYIDLKSRIHTIDCEKAFNTLDTREKNYCYHFSRASWEGSKICYFQRSYESPAFFYILNKIFNLQSLEEMKTLCLKNGFTDDEWTKLTAYCAGFLQNCGNYYSFGDNKFIPEIPKEKLHQFITISEAYQVEPHKFDQIWEAIHKELYEYEEPYAEIGFTNNNCLSSYYSSNMTETDCKFVQEFLESIGVSALNTRVIKFNDKTYQILVCSYNSGGKYYNYKDTKFSIVYGDFGSFMYKSVQSLKEAKEYAANENQKDMLDHYIKHFLTGDVNAHKDSQRAWIKDKGPIVETNIGFIEVYLDPMRVRAEYEGFVAVVDKEQSAKLSKLVEKAEGIISNLPWPKEFEKEKFSKPDFTSLNVLAFACSGTPIGINLPNYDDIVQNEGFKNVDLGNCYPKPKAEYIQFVHPNDVELIAKYGNDALFVIVALHELLGHGTGKLFKKDKEGKFNFDKELKHPLTGEPISKWYEDHETWGSKFGKLSSFYEECRADSVALFLSCYKESLEILLPGLENLWDDIVYAAWLEVVLGAIKGLMYYSTETNQFGQSHIGAAYAILQVLMEAGNGFVKVEEGEKDGKPYVYLTMDRTQIHTTGKKAMGEFLRKLQIYKTTADFEEGSKFFNHYLKVDEKFLRFREIVLENKQPRRIELQHDVIRNDKGDLEYVRFEENFEGVIKSQILHHKNSFEDVYPIWKEYAEYFRYKSH